MHVASSSASSSVSSSTSSITSTASSLSSHSSGTSSVSHARSSFFVYKDLSLIVAMSSTSHFSSHTGSSSHGSSVSSSHHSTSASSALHHWVSFVITANSCSVRCLVVSSISSAELSPSPSTIISSAIFPSLTSEVSSTSHWFVVLHLILHVHTSPTSHLTSLSSHRSHSATSASHALAAFSHLMHEHLFSSSASAASVHSTGSSFKSASSSVHSSSSPVNSSCRESSKFLIHPSLSRALETSSSARSHSPGSSSSHVISSV